MRMVFSSAAPFSTGAITVWSLQRRGNWGSVVYPDVDSKVRRVPILSPSLGAIFLCLFPMLCLLYTGTIHFSVRCLKSIIYYYTSMTLQLMERSRQYQKTIQVIQRYNVYVRWEILPSRHVYCSTLIISAASVNLSCREIAEWELRWFPQILAPSPDPLRTARLVDEQPYSLWDVPSLWNTEQL